MTTAWSQPHRLMIVLLMVAGMFAGCASVFQDLDERMHRKQFRSDYEAFENALALYDEGDFEKALTRFKTLSTASTSKKIARNAWLGEICCRLMLADTPTQYTTAIGMWHNFGKAALEDDAGWDMALLDPLIVRMTPKDTTPVTAVDPPAAQTSDAITAPEDRQTDTLQLRTELAALKKKAERAAQLQRRLDEVVAENSSLKEKIKALEAIDQSIQKKKTEISAPGE